VGLNVERRDEGGISAFNLYIIYRIFKRYIKIRCEKDEKISKSIIGRGGSVLVMIYSIAYIDPPLPGSLVSIRL
jgi:hypothetical protein